MAAGERGWSVREREREAEEPVSYHDDPQMVGLRPADVLVQKHYPKSYY